MHKVRIGYTIVLLEIIGWDRREYNIPCRKNSFHFVAFLIYGIESVSSYAKEVLRAPTLLGTSD
jgi:hypothetical protein